METIRQYLLTEAQMPSAVAQRALLKFERNPDIAAAFEEWIRTRDYGAGSPIRVEGYSAEDISRLAPFMSAAGVFTFLISLREQPEKAREQIASGFPRK